MYLFRLLVVVLQSSSYLEPWVVDRDNLERHSSRRGGLRRARADRAEVRLRSQGDFFERVARKDPTDLFFPGTCGKGRCAVVAVAGEALYQRELAVKDAGIGTTKGFAERRNKAIRQLRCAVARRRVTRAAHRCP